MTAALRHVTSSGLPFDVSAENLGAKCHYYFSDGTFERLAVHLGLLKDYLRFLAGDLSQSERFIFFLGLLFDLI